MKETKFIETIAPKAAEQPFGLHDAHITRMVAKKDKLTLKFKDGFYYPYKDDELSVKGSVVLEGIDYDFAHIDIMDSPGNHGKFKGRRWTVKKFANKFRNIDMIIIDDTFGYNRIVLSGMFYQGDEWKEWSMNIYYTGDMIYLTEDFNKKKKK